MHIEKFYSTIILMGGERIREKAVSLRREGKTYSEILEFLNLKISKSTLSGWCRGIPLSADHQKRIKDISDSNLIKARRLAVEAKKNEREKGLKTIAEKNFHLSGKIKEIDTAKIALAVLYLGEGAKNRKRGSVIFGNSDPLAVSLFLYLLRAVYKIDENKLRCTLQCRADQGIENLERYWSEITNIPLERFYKARVDPRTIGKPSKKLDYKGVCRIDFFSAKILEELLEIPKIIYKGL
ncbi:MAG: hypothetical protein WC397_03180 [Candidatus Paceibacterota bacterium]